MGIIKDDEKKTVNTNNEKPYGVSDSAWQATKESHTVSDKVNEAQTNRDKASEKYASHTNKNMISSSTQKAMNQTFKVPTAVKEADAWLSEQLKAIQSGKTSYSDQVRDMMDKIMNREKFSYDVDSDQLFQQALASAMNSGKQAMQDTIGQASALTGGYGSTYATSAGNQAYNAFIEDAYDNLPQYYKMAMEAYQMEGDEMYRQYGMLSAEDDKEYNRNISAYDATYQHRNQMYNEAYAQYRDAKSDAFAKAGIEMEEHSQKASDLYNLYSMASNTYESMYQKEYQSWQDRINNAWKQVEVQNTDAWANKNFDEGVRQYEQTFAEEQRQYNESLAFSKQQHADQMSYNWASLNSRSSGSGGGGTTLKAPSESQMQKALKAYNEGGKKEFNKYMNSLADSYDKNAILDYVAEYGELPYSQRTYTVVNDGGWNGGWGVDNNAIVKDQYGNKFTLKELAEHDKDIALELSNKKYTKGESYTKK